MAILKCEEPSADITSSIESRDGGMTLKEFSTWLLAPENAEVLNEMTASEYTPRSNDQIDENSAQKEIKEMGKAKAKSVKRHAKKRQIGTLLPSSERGFPYPSICYSFKLLEYF